MRERIVVSDARTAGAFANTRQRRMLLALVARESPLQELAGEAGLTLSLAHYHLSRLLELGLVEATRDQARAGRAVRHYRACARSFLVPSHLESRSGSDQLGAELRASLDHPRHRHPKDGTLYFVDEQSRPRMLRTQRPPDTTVAIELWQRLVLTKEQARLFAGELKALLSRYEARAGDRGKGYLAYCALAPTAGRQKSAERGRG